MKNDKEVALVMQKVSTKDFCSVKISDKAHNIHTSKWDFSINPDFPSWFPYTTVCSK